MTQVAMIFEEEKQQAVTQAVEAERKKAADSERRIVVFLMPNYSKADVEALRKKDAETAN